MNTLPIKQTELSKQMDELITSRTSVRAFLPTPIARETIEALLKTSARAPSGSNTQPWKVHVLQGTPLKALSGKILAVHNAPELMVQHQEEYHYYPVQWVEPYLSRRRKIGWDLYQLLGLTRENKAGMHAQHGRNFQFFDAPVGLIFTVDRVMEQGSWLDYGMFLQNLMLAAKAHGLDTCPQAAFTTFHKIISEALNLEASEMVVCGMSLGWADTSKIENSLQTERATVDQFSHFHGF